MQLGANEKSRITEAIIHRQITTVNRLFCGGGSSFQFLMRVVVVDVLGKFFIDGVDFFR